MKIISGYIDTRSNNEDLALTPYLFMPIVKGGKIYGIGLCWVYYSVFLGLGFNLNKELPKFIFIKRNKNDKNTNSDNAF